jgi:putative exosortase-associated protein (TIGR04073 family)
MVMRSSLLVPLVALGLVVAASGSARAADGVIPCAVWKLGRGLTNVALGIPGEIARHVASGTTEMSGDTAGDWLVGAAGGCVTGLGWGFVRVGSGIADVATFAVPFNHNKPLLEPEFVF